MTKFFNRRFSILGFTAGVAGAFALGTVAAGPLSRFELNRLAVEVNVPATALVIFILGCVLLALHECRAR